MRALCEGDMGKLDNNFPWRKLCVLLISRGGVPGGFGPPVPGARVKSQGLFAADVTHTPTDRPHRVYAVGVDLAWGEAPSGLALMTGPVPDTHDEHNGGAWRLVETARIGPLEGIATWIETRVGADAPVWVAVDAPLFATNPPGTNRDADKRLAAALRAYRVGAFPVNRETARRGAGLVDLLAQKDIAPAVPRPGGTPRRGVFETFPTAAQLHILDLSVPIRYKRGPVQVRQENLERLLLRLAMLEDPALRLEDTGALRELYTAKPRLLRGEALKGFEDRVDALLCAFVAALAWNAPRRLVTYGEPEAGSITIPRPPAI